MLLSRAALPGGAAMLMLLAHTVLGARQTPGPLQQTLGYSSHWWALESLLRRGEPASSAQARRVPRAGERPVGLPATGAPMPNIVLVFLESVSANVCDPNKKEHAAMPTLARLADESAAFSDMRALVPQTGKVMWATLSGTTPDLGPDYVEAVLADEPYEGLPTLLRRVGYRSALFEMAKGSFECAPALCANFGYDQAWFRENLGDESSYLGYLAGDDFRMLEPALTWAARDRQPFLLTLFTSVAHDPFELPAWWGAKPTSDPHERYLQALAYTDAFLARLLEQLQQRGLADSTLLCVLGDHGESFRAESRTLRWVPYEETLRVPWILHWPGRLQAGVRDWPCSQLDVTPTLLTLLGFDLSTAGFEGCNALRPTHGTRRRYFSAWYEGSPLGYVEGATKRVYWPQSGRVTECNLAADPAERSPVVLEPEPGAAVVAELRQWVHDARREFAARRFRHRKLYEHWQVFCSGRYARAYYVP